MHAFHAVHPRIFFSTLIAWVCLGAALASGIALAQTCPFDDGHSSLAVEGLIFTRYALGITGAPLVASSGINAVDAPTVEASINCPSCGLNITGNPALTVADATIISRKLAGFSGAALTDGVALGTGTRNTPAAVQSFLLSGCGATGGTVTSITAGTGLSGGVITGSGTIAADTSYLQRRVSSTCTGGSFITTIAADGTVTCGTPTVGGGGTVTNVSTGAGLAGGPITATGTTNLTATQLLPTTACAANQIAKWNGSVWTCAADNDVNNVANDARYFKQGGNAFGAAAVLGTTDGQPLTVGIGGGNGLRIAAGSSAYAPNIVNGSAINSASGDGATVAGGGGAGGCLYGGPIFNLSRSCANSASGSFTTVSGGVANVASQVNSAVVGGSGNSALGDGAFVGAGFANFAGSAFSTTSGGFRNLASEVATTIGGGEYNSATSAEAAVGGGGFNAATGRNSLIPGGSGALASLTGQMAHASGQFNQTFSPTTGYSATTGNAQASEYVLRAATTGAGVTNLFLDGTAATLLFEAGRAALLDIQVVALQNNAAGNLATWSFKCMYQVNPGGNGFVVPAGCGKTAVQKDGTASTWEANVTKGASQELLITATGEAAKSIRWVATVRATEVKW